MSDLTLNIASSVCNSSVTLDNVYVNGIAEGTAANSFTGNGMNLYASTTVSSGANYNTGSITNLMYITWSSLTESISSCTSSTTCCTAACTSKCTTFKQTITVSGFTWQYNIGGQITTTAPSSVNVGDSITFTATGTGGDGSYTYLWYYYVNNDSATSSTVTTSSYSVNVPAAAANGTFTVYCAITGSSTGGNEQTYNTNSITVDVSDNLSTVLTVTPSQGSYTISSSGTVDIEANTTNGTGTYQSTTIYSNYSSTQCAAAPANGSAIPSSWTEVASASASPYDSVSYTFSLDQTAGYYCIYASGVDSSGYTAFDGFQLNLVSGLTVTAVTSSNELNVGQFTDIVAEVSNGSGNYSYQWFMNGVTLSGETSSSFQYYPNVSGVTTFECTVVDLTANTSVNSNTISITSYDPMATNITPTKSSITVANGNLTTITLTFTNESTDIIPSGSQIYANINWSEYSDYLSSDVGNVRFFDINNNPVYAWLESFVSPNNSSASNATSSIVWFKLNSAIDPNFGSYSIMMQIQPTDVDFDGVYWGCSPLLTGTYGLYDNGANVFDNYYNFAGSTISSSLSSYIINGTTSSNNGLNINLPASSYGAYVISAGVPLNTIVDVYSTGTRSTDSPSDVAIYNGNSSTNGGYAGIGAFYGYGTISSTPTEIGSLTMSEDSGIASIYWTATGVEGFGWNYNFVTCNNSSETIGTLNYPSFGIVDSGSGSNMTYYWFRVRQYVSVNPVLSISGGYQTNLTVEIAGGSGSFNYAWFDGSESLINLCGNNLSCLYSANSGGTHFIYASVQDLKTNQTLTSPISLVTVTGGLTIGVSPVSQSIAAGSSFSISVTLKSNTNQLSYSWYSNTVNSNIGGTALNIFNPVFTSTQLNTGSTYYYCVVTDLESGVSSVSTVATINVYFPQTVSLSTSSTQLLLGNSATLTATVSDGSGNFVYDWMQIAPDGTETSLNNPTSDTYTFSTTSSTATGVYTLFVAVTDTSTDFVSYSNNIYINVYNFTVTITTNGSTFTVDQVVNAYSSITGGTPPFQYEWSAPSPPKTTSG